MNCPDCNETNRTYTFKLIPTNRKNDYYPRFIPQIKENCFNCSRYIKFAKQTPELIETINRKLEGVII